MAALSDDAIQWMIDFRLFLTDVREPNELVRKYQGMTNTELLEETRGFKFKVWALGAGVVTGLLLAHAGVEKTDKAYDRARELLERACRVL